MVLDTKPATGAKVFVQAWPAPSVLQGLSKGSRVPMLDLGTVTVDNNGEFSVQPVKEISTRYLDHGSVALEIVVTQGAKLASWTASATTRGGNIWSEKADLLIDLGLQPGVEDLNDPPSSWDWGGKAPQLTRRGLIPTSLSKVTPAQALAPLSGGCYTTDTGVRTDPNEHYMNAYALFSHATITVSESTNSTHHLGIGYQDSYKHWSQNGSIAFTEVRSGSGTYSGLYDDMVYNKVHYEDYFTTAPCSYTKRRPIATDAFFSQFQYQGHPQWTHCQLYYHGTYVKAQGTDVTFSGGVGLGPIAVSAQSGWNTSTSEEFDVIDGQPAELCGSNDYYLPAQQAEAR